MKWLWKFLTRYSIGRNNNVREASSTYVSQTEMGNLKKLLEDARKKEVRIAVLNSESRSNTVKKDEA